MQNTAIPIVLAACDDTNPYIPPQLLGNQRLSPSVVWQGRGRATHGLISFELIRSVKAKHKRAAPIKMSPFLKPSFFIKRNAIKIYKGIQVYLLVMIIKKLSQKEVCPPLMKNRMNQSIFSMISN